MSSTALPDLLATLRRVFGFADFRPGQRDVIDAVLRGENVLAVMPTGSGKSLCYQLPACLLPGCIVVVSPLIALMKDQMDRLPRDLAGVSTCLHSALDGAELDRRMRAIASGSARLVYAAPERMGQLPFLHCLARARPSLFVVDEAHCVSLWGHDFRPDYATLHLAIDALGRPPLLALTATATSETERDIGAALGVALRTFRQGVRRPNLHLAVRHCVGAEDKRARLADLCRATCGRGIVYVSARKRAEALAELLRECGVAAGHYHAAMDREARGEAQDAFDAGEIRVMVATIAFGMGIDAPDVRFVLHFDPPSCIEEYAQAIGRAGRDGLPSRCEILVSRSDRVAMDRRTAQDTPKMETMAAAYRAVRSLLTDGAGLVALDDVCRASGCDSVPIRVALAYLERCGLLKRLPDAPVCVSIRQGRKTGGAGAPGSFGARLAELCPKDGGWIDLPTPSAARALGVELSQVEPVLLQAQEQGWIRFRGSMRDRVYERMGGTREAKSRLDELIATYGRVRSARLRAVHAYLDGAACRQAQIAAYFGEADQGPCGVCDNCLGTDGPGPASDFARPVVRRPRRPRPSSATESPVDQSEALRVVVLCVLAGLPCALDRSELVGFLLRDRCPRHLQKLPSCGALSGLDAEAAARLLQKLIDAGELALDARGDRQVVRLTAKGARALRTDGAG
jgi:ATP-dependent DNA helicase RecQ